MPLPIKRILVFGGNGYVGQAVMKAALSLGYDVVGLCRRGGPGTFMHDLDKHPDYSRKASWQAADISGSPSEYWHNFNNETAVISCVGKLGGTDESMRLINGDANVALIKAAHEKRALRFVFISAYDVEKDLPFKILPGYFQGKREAEAALKEHYPNQDGVILKPGFVYGTRIESGFPIPLGFLGGPMEFIFNIPGLSSLQNWGGIGKLLFTPPVSVHAVATAAVRGAAGTLDEQYIFDEKAVISDDNEHNPKYNAHQKPVELDVAAINKASVTAATI